MQKIVKTSGETPGIGGDDLRASDRAVPMHEWLSAEGGEVNRKALQEYSLQIEGSHKE